MKRNKDNQIYIKYIALLDFIMKNSDYDHPLTLKDIQSHLQNLGDYKFSINARQLNKYIEDYNRYHNDDLICYHKVGRTNQYYYVWPLLDVMEAKAIVDLIYSSDFFTINTKNNYKTRLQALFNQPYHHYFDKSLYQHIQKNQNEIVFYQELEKIIAAIYQHKMISFDYIKPDYKANQIKKHYTLAPVDTIFNDNEYYLICQGTKDPYDCILYRLDYVRNVTVIKDSNVIFKDKHIDSFTNKIFHSSAMFTSGHLENVTLQFEQDIYTNIIDKFGQSIQCKKINDTHLQTTIQTIVNHTFYGWIVQFNGKIQIIGNQDQVDRFQTFLQEKFIQKA